MNYLNYVIEVHIGLLFFVGIYWLLLRKETQFGMQRAFLLGSIVASLLFPLISISSGEAILIPSLSQTTAAQWLPELIIYANATGTEAASQPQSTSYWPWIERTYVIGLCVFLLLFLIRISALFSLFSSAKKYVWKNFLVAESHSGKGTFSFFNFIFLGRADLLNEVEKQNVLHHEEVHARQLHSLDILLVNMLGIIFWFNPLIRYYKKSLVQLHEFEADARSVEDRDVDAYCSLLAKAALQTQGFTLANHFTNSFTLTRINMIKTIRRRITGWKLASVALTIPVFFFVVACQDQVMQEMSESSITQMGEYPAEVSTEMNKLKTQFPDTKFIYVEGDTRDIRSLIEKAGSFQIIMNTFEFKETSTIGVILKDVNDLSNLTKQEGDVFAVVEESAAPTGGFPTLYQHLASHMQYPVQARRSGIEGKVFIEFIVNTDGSISNLQPIKGIGGGCDMEAVRVLSTSNIIWKPGKQGGVPVRQRLVLPITFKLGSSAPSDDQGAAKSDDKTLDELVVVGHGTKKQ